VKLPGPRRAYLTAQTAKVYCPYCHEAAGQEEISFSLRELLDILDGKQTAIMVCGACSRQFVMHAQTIHGVLRP
jgi:hypothetical protein